MAQLFVIWLALTLTLPPKKTKMPRIKGIDPIAMFTANHI